MRSSSPSLFRMPWAVLAAALAALLVAGCERIRHTDTRPLDDAGMAYSSIQALLQMDVTNEEVAEVARARTAGLSDRACLELVRIARARNEPFAQGATVASLRRVGVADDTILELARLGQLGLEAGEYQAMRLAGLADEIILAVARRRSVGQPAMSGGSLAQLKNAGLRDATLLELVGRGVPDSEAERIVTLRRRGASDAAILAGYR